MLYQLADWHCADFTIGHCADFTKMSRLSLVAEYDDLVRCRTVLSAGIETGFNTHLFLMHK